MLSQDEKKVLLSKVKEKKELIKELRSKLNDVNQQKEDAFEKKNKTSQDIKAAIAQLKDAKGKRDGLTDTVKKNKGNRNDLNKKIKEKVDELKKLELEKDAIVKKHNIKGDPISIKKQIDQLEYKLETSVMSFDKEKVLMKEINELRKRYKDVEKVSSVWKKIHPLSKEVDELRKEANTFHRKIQVQANQSQERHEILIESSKIIKDLKKKEKDAMDKFILYKKQFNEINDQLKDELREMNILYGKLDMNREEVKEIRKEKQNKTLEEKRKEVNEKLKSGKKLTTEDLLAFQSQDED
ncbi:MAG: hypothetical protein ABIG89_02505 [Candidatus Woesearchaeota archaeon]